MIKYIALILPVCIALSSCDGNTSGNTMPSSSKIETSHDVKVSVEEKKPEFEYLGDVTGYSFMKSPNGYYYMFDIGVESIRMKLEANGDNYVTIDGNGKRSRVSIGHYVLDGLNETRTYNACCTMSDGRKYYFNI